MSPQAFEVSPSRKSLDTSSALAAVAAASSRASSAAGRRSSVDAPAGPRPEGFGVETLSLWLNGHRKPPLEFEAEAAEALDLLEQAERAAAGAGARVLNGRRVRRVGEAPGLAARLGRRTADGSIAPRR